MRLRHIALGCALTGGLGFLALPTGPAVAATSGLAGAEVSGNPARSETTGHPGNAGHAPGKAVRPRISVSSPVTDSPYGAAVTLTVTLRPALRDRKVSLYATPHGGARTLVAAGPVDAKGRWHVRYSMTRATTFAAVFPGDAHHARVSASRTLGAYARVTDRLGGAHSSSRSGSGVVYDNFRGADTLTLYSTAAPDKHGECLEPETEQYDKGIGWHADTRYGCDALDGASHDTAPFSLSQAVGDRYRIRGDYLRGQDAANLDAQGPWLYFTVGK